MIGPVSITIHAHVNHRRLEHMKAHAIAKLRRAPKKDRAAMLQRFVDAMFRECVRTEVKP